MSQLWYWKPPFRQTLFMCTLDHLGKMRSFKQQRHHFFLFDPSNALNLAVDRHAPTRFNHIVVSQLQRIFIPSIRGVGGEATLKSIGPSLKMSDREVLWASPSPTFNKSTPGIWDIGPLSEQCGRSLSAVLVCWQVRRIYWKLYERTKFLNSITLLSNFPSLCTLKRSKR